MLAQPPARRSIVSSSSESSTVENAISWKKRMRSSAVAPKPRDGTAQVIGMPEVVLIEEGDPVAG